MFIKLLSAIVFSATISSCVAQNYILTPKGDLTPKINVNVFSEIAYNNNLNELASFLNDNDFTVIYQSDHQNVMKNKNELEKYFHIEEDKQVTINDVADEVTNEDGYVYENILDQTNNNFQMVYKNTDMPSDVLSDTPWHLNRVTKRSLSNENDFLYNTPNSCHKNKDLVIDTYIVDTGIDVSHPEFQNRAVWSANFADNVNTDCNNHGTHVAGLVGSKSYGVCVDAKLYAVKVLNCEGSGSLSGVIKGIEWVYNEHKRKSKSESKKVKSVINMSLGGGYSAAINKAVEMAVNGDDNFYIVVAAGNENNDACNTSPASAPSVMTVMASDQYDNKAWFSNWGKCADLYSPGVDVLSTIPHNGTAKYSGTSMASPVMTGVLNHYLDMYPELNMKNLKKLIKKKATKNVIKGNKNGSKNLLAYFEH